MAYLIADCDRCENERYVEEGRAPCPRCNPGVARLEFDEGQSCCFLVSGPVEINVNGELFDVDLRELEATFHLGGHPEVPVVVIPELEASG